MRTKYSKIMASLIIAISATSAGATQFLGPLTRYIKREQSQNKILQNITIDDKLAKDILNASGAGRLDNFVAEKPVRIDIKTSTIIRDSRVLLIDPDRFTLVRGKVDYLVTARVDPTRLKAVINTVAEKVLNADRRIFIGFTSYSSVYARRRKRRISTIRRLIRRNNPEDVVSAITIEEATGENGAVGISVKIPKGVRVSHLGFAMIGPIESRYATLKDGVTLEIDFNK